MHNFDFILYQIPDTTSQELNIQATPDTSASIKKIEAEDTLKNTLKKVKKDSAKTDTTVLKNKATKAEIIEKNERNETAQDSLDIVAEPKFEVSVKPVFIFRQNPFQKNDSAEVTLFDNLSISNSVLKYAKRKSVQAENNKTKESIITTEKSNEKIKEIPFQINKTGWELGILIFGLVLFSWIKIFSGKYFSSLFKSLFNYQMSTKFFRENNFIIQRISFFMNFFFIIIFSMLLFLTTDYFSIKLFFDNEIISFFAVCGIISAVYLTKYAVYKILGFVFLETPAYNEYIFNIFLYNKTIGIILLPITIGILYMPEMYTKWLIVSGYLSFFIFFIIRIIRGLQICFRSGFSIFYIILYLCTLEILPLAMIIKLILSFV